MRNILLTIEYDGTNYHGWQRQKNALSIQEVLERSIFKVTGERVNVIGSGRTDAGVHALGQRANFKTNTRIPAEKIPYALNGVLPPDIKIVDAVDVPLEFHARYDAVKKRYRYRIYNSTFPTAIYRNYCYFVPQRLDIIAMRKASEYFIGEKDFTSFTNSGSPVKSKVRRIDLLEVVQKGKKIDIIIEANGFLYNMARIISGTLLEVGKGKLHPEEVVEIIKAKNREMAGPTLPAHGLFLEAVFYKL